jgi:uncharacterized membrane protein
MQLACHNIEAARALQNLEAKQLIELPRKEPDMDESSASRIVTTIDVDVPVTEAYNQWTQFEDFPQFMEGVESVEQIDDKTLRWKADIGGVHKEWTARITEQTPDKRIAWTSTDGAANAGVVTFHYISDSTSRVALQLDYEPQGVVESIGDMLGAVSRRTQGDLERFKAFIESRGSASGAFRGTIPSGDARQ